MSCNFCIAPLYIKTIQYAKPLLAPATEAEALRQRIQDITGEVYVMVPKKYCPICGEKIHNKTEKQDYICKVTGNECIRCNPGACGSRAEKKGGAE